MTMRKPPFQRQGAHMRIRHHAVSFLPPCVALLATAVFFSAGCKGEQGPAPLTEFKAEVKVLEPSKSIVAGEPSCAQLEIKNTGTQTWSAKGSDANGVNAVHVAYRLLDTDKKVLAEGGRTVLPKDMPPN